MTPWVRATVLLIVVGAGGSVPSYGSARAYGGESSPYQGARAFGGRCVGGRRRSGGRFPGPFDLRFLLRVVLRFPSRLVLRCCPRAPGGLRSRARTAACHRLGLRRPLPLRRRALAGRQPGGSRAGAAGRPVESEPVPDDAEVQDAEKVQDADEGLIGDEGLVGEVGEKGVDGDVDGQADGEATAVPDAPRKPSLVPSAPPTQDAGQADARPAEPRLPILPLGGGLILVGLGLGLAFIALRLRRGTS
ncbi:hypothetical protein SALBM311S_03657 [Streptomyces alboniger]